MKKVIVMFLILIMSLTFVACGNKTIEEEIIGNWIFTETDNTYIINFTTDSFKMTMVSGNYDDFFEYDGDYSINKEEKKIYDYNEVILNKEEAYKEALNRSIDVINKKLSSDEYIISKKVLKKEVKRSKINLEVFFKVYEKIGVTSEIQDIGEENGEYN